MDEQRSVRYKLKKQPLASEREEIKNKKHHRNALILSIIVFLLVGFLAGFVYGVGRNSGAFVIGSQDTNAVKSEMINEYFKEAWLYGDDYENLSETMSEQAFHGMTFFKDDPYTTYQSNKEMNDFASAINMNFVGIGVSYTMSDDVPTITRVFKDAPAEKAGLMPGDVLIAVDGKNLEGLTTEEIKELVIGKEDTLVKVSVNRQGQELVFDIFRGPVDSTVYGYELDGIPVLNIMSFGEKTHDECIKYLDGFTESDRLIIDLRDNSGGYQTAVEDIAGLFLPKDSLVMRVVDKHDDEVVSYVRGKKFYDNFEEIAILINGNTASAAEVLTMSLVEQHPNAYTVGETSYGKGVVQTTIPLFDGSALKLTTSKWLSPKGVWINGVGIAPDFEVLKHPALYETYWAMEDGEEYAVDSVSEFVRLASLGLDYLDYPVEREDGYFDESLAIAIEMFQNDHHAAVTGVLDKETYRMIVSAITKTYAMDVDKDVQMQTALDIIQGE